MTFASKLIDGKDIDRAAKQIMDFKAYVVEHCQTDGVLHISPSRMGTWGWYLKSNGVAIVEDRLCGVNEVRVKTEGEE